MFHGTIPSGMQKIVKEVTDYWDCKDIHIGCSGNFTIERILDSDKFRIHSNDVTVYSYVLGRLFERQPIKISLKEEYLESDLGFFSDYMETPEDKAATVMLCTKILDGVGKDDNLYYKRINEANKAQWADMHEKTKSKFVNGDFKIASYYNGDVIDWVQELDKESGFISFPPFYAGDYKNMFAKIEEVFNWDEPGYEELTEERKQLLIDEIQKFKYWLVGFNFKVPELEEHLVGITKTTNRGVPIYLYGTSQIKRIVVPNQKTEKVKIERLGMEEEVGQKLGIVRLSNEQFQSLRSVYMNRYINPGQASLAMGVVVDGKLVGVYAFSSAPSFANYDGKIETPHIYLLSDFPVAPTQYKHMAKLVLFAALSKESKHFAERLTGRRVRSLVTTAFSNRKASMKYRGLFELISRKERDIEPGSLEHDNQKYQLNYGARMGDWTLDEGFEEWKKRYGGKRR